MGCDFCVYLPDKKGDHDCGMAYSSFNAVRADVVFAYLKVKGIEDKLKIEDDMEKFALSLNIVPLSTEEKVSKILRELYTDEGDSMLALWEHSDCDGSFCAEDCRNLGRLIKELLPHIENKYTRERAKMLAETFEYAGERDGIVEVC